MGKTDSPAVQRDGTELTQTFYNAMASQYGQLFQDWAAATREQAVLLDRIFRESGFDSGSSVLDCACGIGTQAIGLAELGYSVTASDLSVEELAQARRRADEHRVQISFHQADFRALSAVFGMPFDIVIAMDNALPHMLSAEALSDAVRSICGQLVSGGLFVASIRNYDALLEEKPGYSAPYIHKTETGQRVSFQTWDWSGDHYQFTQYLITDDGNPEIRKFVCEYRAVRRQELTDLLWKNGCQKVVWKMPEETGFYQPIVIAQKSSQEKL